MSDENKLEINQETEEKIENSNNESETNFDIDVGEIKNDSEKLMDNIETLDVDSEIMGVSKEEQEKLEKEFPIDWNEIEYEAANPDIPKITSEDLRILVITKLVSESRSELENSVNLLKDIMKKTKRSLDEKDKKPFTIKVRYQSVIMFSIFMIYSTIFHLQCDYFRNYMFIMNLIHLFHYRSFQYFIKQQIS